MPHSLRNVAIIAHVDHGKTSLVDQMLRQSGMFRAAQLDKLAGGQHGLIFDSNDLERERGITILSKNCALNYHALSGERVRINVIDTPGHSDFGGEVERVLRMADGCLLVVDAFEGPMPQTRFVLEKALGEGLKPIVVVNKCDRSDARPDAVVDEVFDLLVSLGADDDTLDFAVVYASARDGWASRDHTSPASDIRAVFETIVEHVPPAGGDAAAPLQILITNIDASEYVGRIGVGRVFQGTIHAGSQIAVLKRDGARTVARVAQLLHFEGLDRAPTKSVSAGDICAVVGVEGIDIGDTLADPASPVALPPVSIDEPTITMLFRVNDSPFAGKEGQYVTSRQIKTRLEREAERDVALRIEPSDSAEEFRVSGRGVLHLGILIETMRREGYELAVGRPRVILREIDGKKHEPIERVVVDCPERHVGAVMELLGSRGAELQHMEARGDITRLEFDAPSRSLIGLRTRLLTATQGEAVFHHIFDRYEPQTSVRIGRKQGVMIATEQGAVTAFAVDGFADRGVLFVTPGDKVYAGQVVGEHNRDNDLPLNIVREKRLNNIRSATKEAFTVLKTARSMSLEASLEYIEDDELVEVTPTCVRMRKRILNEGARRRAIRQGKATASV